MAFFLLLHAACRKAVTLRLRLNANLQTKAALQLQCSSFKFHAASIVEVVDLFAVVQVRVNHPHSTVDATGWMKQQLEHFFVDGPLPSRSQPSSTAPFPSPLPNDTRSAPSTSINSSNHPIKRLSSSVNPEPSPKRSRIGVAPNASAFQAAYAAMFEASSLPPPNNAQYDPKSPSFSHQQPLPPSPVLHQRRPSQSTLSSRQPVLVGPLATACMTCVDFLARGEGLYERHVLQHDILVCGVCSLLVENKQDTLRCHRAHCHQQQQMPGQSSLEQQPPLLPFQTPYPSPPQTYELPRRRSTQDPIAAVPGPSSIYAIPSPNSSGTRRKSEVYALPTPPSRTISTDRQLHQRARQLPPLVQSTVVNLIRFAQEFPGTGEGSERTQKAGERPVSWEEALQGLRAAVQRVEKVEGYRSNECAGVGL